MIVFCGSNVIVHRYVILLSSFQSQNDWLEQILTEDINWLKITNSHAYFCSAKVDILLQTLRDSRHWIKPYYNIFIASYKEYDSRLLLIRNYRKHYNITSHDAGPVEASFCCFK